MSDAHNPGGELHSPRPPPRPQEEGFDLLYLWVITPRSGLQVRAQGGPGDLPTLQVRGLVHSCQPQEKSA